ncbi:MAG: NAD(P)-dependent oxidoreductase [Blautia sp.]|nr:NAD(P)-dependent oxidoreductase [Blautia sp.]MCM1200956.1 NAD(P)-dependent oxidoreductase [Bacteroides fragilis]
MERVLVTGGTGYIGQYVCNLLKEMGYEVIITSRKNTANVLGYPCRYLELLDTESIEGCCKDIDIVIHMANLDERLIKERTKEAFLANSYATREIYLDAVKNGVKQFIYLSTFHVYGKSDGIIDEMAEIHPKTDYALSHYFAECFLKQLSEQTTCKVSVIRLANGIGLPLADVDKWYLAVNDFCRLAYYEKKITMKSNGLPIRDFIAIKDVAQAVLVLMQQNEKQKNIYDIYNISMQKTYSIREIAIKVAEVYESKYHGKVFLEVPEVTEQQIQEIKPLLFKSEKIRCMGWKPESSIEKVIEEIFDWLDKESYCKGI